MMELLEPDEDALRQGDPRAFAALYARNAPRVMGYLLRLGCSRSDAEDLTQETFLAAYQGSTRYSGRSRPLAWLLGIAVRRWRDSKRRKPVPKDHALPPPDAAQQAVRRLSLEEALGQLDEPLREVLLLVGGQQLSYAEAAAALEIPLGTLKWRMHEATQQMRRLLAEDDQ